jgi:hypothetical protein
MSEKPSQSKEIKDETINRFLGFVKDRVVVSKGEISHADYEVDDSQQNSGSYSIEYEYSLHEPDRDGVSEDGSITIHIDGDNTFSYGVDNAHHASTQRMVGATDYMPEDADDDTINNIIDRIQSLEEQGNIVKVQGSDRSRPLQLTN